MNRIQIHFRDKALEKRHLLTEYEIQFLLSLCLQSSDDDYELSEKQNHLLNQIQRKTS